MSGDEAFIQAHMSYDDWQTRLSEEFFQEKTGKHPIIMFFDDEELTRICPDCTDATDSLRSAVMAELRQTESQDVLQRIQNRISLWSGGSREEPPPVLPLLALTVVAGSHMRNDGAFSASAYYPRLSHLMSPNSTDIRARGIRKHFNKVAESWQLLDSWISSNQDRLGPSTISTHDFFSKIGYPLSQAVLKTSDREHLADFFEGIRLDSRSLPSVTELLRLLRLWLDRPRGLSAPFLHLVEQGSENPLLLDLIMKLAANHGGPSVVQGRIRLNLSLCIDLEAWTHSWVIPVHDDLEADDLKHEDGSLLSIVRPDYGSTYELREGSFTAGPGFVDRRFRASGGHSVLVKDIRGIWILRMNPTSGKWQSVNSMESGYEHLLMVRAAEADSIARLLSKKALPGYRKLRRQLIHGWDLYADVLPAGAADQEDAPDNGMAHVFKTDVGPSPRLVNGLVLRTDVGGRHYLQGGEPDLLVPSGGSTRYVSVVLDGVPQVPPLKATGEPLPLRFFGPMAEGKHRIEADGITLDFFVHASGTAAQLDHARSRPTVDPADPLFRSMGPAYVLCRRGKKASIWFVLPSGRVRQHHEPRVPSFVERSGFPVSLSWKASVPEDAVWAITERNGQFAQPRYIRNQVQDFGFLDALSENFWRRITPATITSSDARWRACLSNFLGESVHGR